MLAGQLRRCLHSALQYDALAYGSPEAGGAGDDGAPVTNDGVASNLYHELNMAAAPVEVTGSPDARSHSGDSAGDRIGNDSLESAGRHDVHGGSDEGTANGDDLARPRASDLVDSIEHLPVDSLVATDDEEEDEDSAPGAGGGSTLDDGEGEAAGEGRGSGSGDGAGEADEAEAEDGGNAPTDAHPRAPVVFEVSTGVELDDERADALKKKREAFAARMATRQREREARSAKAAKTPQDATTRTPKRAASSRRIRPSPSPGSARKLGRTESQPVNRAKSRGAERSTGPSLSLRERVRRHSQGSVSPSPPRRRPARASTAAGAAATKPTRTPVAVRKRRGSASSGGGGDAALRSRPPSAKRVRSRASMTKAKAAAAPSSTAAVVVDAGEARTPQRARNAVSSRASAGGGASVSGAESSRSLDVLATPQAHPTRAVAPKSTKSLRDSNHHRLRNALTTVCLAGPHQATRRQLALDMLGSRYVECVWRLVVASSKSSQLTWL